MAHTHRKLELPAQVVSAPACGDATRPMSRVTFVGDTALVEGIVAGNPAAMVEFHERFAVPVQRILWGILGPDRELSDLHHDVFVRALSSIRKLKSPDALRGWMAAIAVHTAKSAIEKRLSRRRWMTWAPPEPKFEGPAVDPSGQLDAREALRAIHVLLDQLPVAERIVFALRFLDGQELSDVALACDVSVATVKRRLASAEARFGDLATRSPVLCELMKEGSARWTRR